VPHSQPSITDPTKTYREVAGDLFAENVEEAQKLMAEAGYPGGAGFPEVELVVRATEEQKNFAQALQSLWQENLGVTVTIRTVEASSTYWSELAAGQFGIDRSGYTVGYLDPSANLVIWKSGGNAFENQWPDDEGRTEFNAMMDKANALLDPAEREAALIEAEKYLVEMMPGFPVYSYNVSYLVKPYIVGLTRGVTGAISWEYASFAE
jgi:oligopeptide transport system substrate-binding protein